MKYELITTEDADGIKDRLAALIAKGEQVMATIQEMADQLTQTVTELQALTAPLADAINTMEARITAALATASVPQATQDQITAAITNLHNVATSINAALSDAADMVDEGATPTEGGGGPT